MLRDLPVEQWPEYGIAARRAGKPKFSGQLPTFTVADLTDSARSDSGLPPLQRRRKKKTPANAPDPVWRENKLSAEEYRVYNENCTWRALLAPFNEHLNGPCNNCSGCCPNDFPLAALMRDELEGTEDTIIVKRLREELKNLALELGNEQDNQFMRILSPNPLERVLTSTDRRQFSASYQRVAQGDLMGWNWTKVYGNRVIEFIRKAICAGPMPPGFSPVANVPISPAQVQLELPSLSAVDMPRPPPRQLLPSTMPTNQLPQPVLKERSTNVRCTPRGDVAYIKNKRVPRGTKRAIATINSEENEPVARRCLHR